MKNPLLLLHGAIGSKAQMEPIKSLLSSDFEVHTFNFTGHGGRDSNGKDFSIDLFTQDVLDYMAENKIEQVDIFGYSMGGYVALNLARLHPEKVDKIFTLATQFAWAIDKAEKEVKMLNPITIEAKIPAFAKTLQERHAPQDWKEVLHKTGEMMMRLGAGERLTLDDLGVIETPLVVAVGDQDTMVSHGESELIAEMLNGEFLFLEGVPHPIEKVDLGLLEGYLRDFF